jgi:methylmalonyl-CoA/ethylmalonyl-CoA epimerase
MDANGCEVTGWTTVGFCDYHHTDKRMVRGSVTRMDIHHLGWAVRSIEANRRHFEVELGLPAEAEELAPGLRLAFFRAGSSLIELLEPLDQDSDIASFLHRRGEGLHHVAYRVPDVQAALDGAVQRGLVPLDAAPRPGSRRTTIAFVDPQRSDGALIEFVQEPT